MTKIKLKLTRDENLRHYGVPYGSVITLDIEDYLCGVVPSEVYEGSTPEEALKVQAIAARTYALRKHLDGVVMDDTANYQAYRVERAGASPRSRKAVLDTRGMALTYEGQVINCFYSASNGGVTKRSGDVWSKHYPYYVSKPDPWDVEANRIKPTKASHGVGMSQIGAAYAASIGKSYLEILAFYYENTRVVGGYGEGNAPMEHTNLGLVKHAQDMLGQPYWYGTCCYPCTESLLKTKTKQYPSHYGEKRMAIYRKDIAGGKIASDCVGLIKGYYWQDENGKQAYKGSTDYSAGSMLTAATVKGPIHTLPEVPGLILHKEGHVGVYEGNGTVIESRGFSKGVLRSNLADVAWTSWFACPVISYAGFEEQLSPEPFTEPYTALVVTKSTPLNLWDTYKKGKSLKQVPKGATVRVVGYGGQVGWLKAEHDGVTGVSDGQYLQRVGVVWVEESKATESEPDKPAPYEARVINVTKGLNLRTTPENTTGNTICTLPIGTLVTVLQDNCGNGFCKVRAGNTTGYCTRSYLLAEGGNG